MALDVEKEIKITFLVGFIIALIYGLWFLISVESWAAITGWPFFDPVAGRILGSVFVAVAIVLLKSYREADQWERIENVVIFMAGYCILAGIVSIITQVLFNLPVSNILNIILYLILGILNCHIYLQKRA